MFIRRMPGLRAGEGCLAFMWVVRVRRRGEDSGHVHAGGVLHCLA